jgi:hypothetical protein
LLAHWNDQIDTATAIRRLQHIRHRDARMPPVSGSCSHR